MLPLIILCVQWGGYVARLLAGSHFLSQVQLKTRQSSIFSSNHQSSFENLTWSQFLGKVERKLLLIQDSGQSSLLCFSFLEGEGEEQGGWVFIWEFDRSEFLVECQLDAAPLQQQVLEPMGELELLLEEKVREVDDEEEKHREDEVGEGGRARGRVRRAAVGTTRLGRRHWVRRWNIFGLRVELSRVESWERCRKWVFHVQANTSSCWSWTNFC